MVGLNKKQDAKEKNRQINVVKGAAEAYLEVTRQNGCVSLSDLVADGYLSEKEAKNFKDQSVYIEKNENGEIIFDTYKTAESCFKSYDSYVISFDANGGIGSISNVTITPDSSTEDPVIDLSSYNSRVRKDGYTLVGWTDNTSSNAKVYTNKYPVKASKTLYAKWEKDKFAITYESEGNVENMPAKQIGDFGTNVSVSSTIPTRKGYKFLGWSETLNGDVKYRSGDRITINNSLILYAVWQKREFKITLVPNGGTVSPTTKIVTSDDAIESVKHISSSENYGYQIEQETDDKFVVVVYDSTTLDTVTKYNVDKNNGAINQAQDIDEATVSVTMSSSSK